MIGTALQGRRYRRPCIVYSFFFHAFGSKAAPSRASMMPQRNRPPQNSTMRSSRVPIRIRPEAVDTKFQKTLVMEDHSTKLSGTHSVKMYTGCTEKVSSSQAAPTKAA